MRITETHRRVAFTSSTPQQADAPQRAEKLSYRPTSPPNSSVTPLLPTLPGGTAKPSTAWKQAVDRTLQAEKPFASLRRAEATHIARRIGRHNERLDAQALVAPFGPLTSLPAESIKEVLHTLTHIAGSCRDIQKLAAVTTPLVSHADPEVRMMVSRLLAATCWEGFDQVKMLAQDPVLGVRIVALCTLRTWGYGARRGAAKPHLCQDFTAWRADHPYPKRSDLPRLYDIHKSPCVDSLTFGDGTQAEAAAYAEGYLNRYLQGHSTRNATIELAWLVPVEMWTVPALLSCASDRNLKDIVVTTLQKIGSSAALYGAAALSLTDFNGMAFFMGTVDHPVAAQFWFNLQDDGGHGFANHGFDGLGYQYHNAQAREFLLKVAVTPELASYDAKKALARDNRPKQANEFFDLIEAQGSHDLHAYLSSWTDVHPALVSRFEAWARQHADASVREEATQALLRSSHPVPFECGLAMMREAKPEDRGRLVPFYGLHGEREKQVSALVPLRKYDA